MEIQYLLFYFFPKGKSYIYGPMIMDLYRHLIPVLNAWAARQYCTTARPIATHF